ncbi:hypothetical protein RvY_06153-2 [Ramazzottius varieornatus]|uniref:Uncharacterized protein n=1 Tax=Ramazzottius varieornatus TaxID=947166 RepID=A0A1D1V783_RAMVA|nr:hypothetical protein RvY_06153-2 [Ramazzottius varieornatus]
MEQDTEMEVLVPRVQQQVQRRVRASTTSVIAAHSGNTRIVVAVLTHGDELELRLQEMQPSLLHVGNSLEEILELQMDLNECLVKLQSKEMEIEQALAQSDELVVRQGIEPQLHMAMADSLGKAWMIFYDMLSARVNLLEYSFFFRQQYSKCTEFFDKILNDAKKGGSSEDENRDSPSLIKEVLERFKETLMGSHSLIDLLERFTSEHLSKVTTLSAFPAKEQAVNSITSLIENLSDKRRHVVQQLAQRQSSIHHDAIVTRARLEFHQLMKLHEDMEQRSKSMATFPVTREYGREMLKEYEKILNTVQVMEDSLTRLKARVSNQSTSSALQLLEEISTFETFLVSSQITWEKQSYVLDLCMDGYSLVETAHTDLEDLVRRMQRPIYRRGSSPKLDELLREIISLPKSATKQSMFLAENSAHLDIGPLLNAVSHLQDECQETSQQVVKRQEDLLMLGPEDQDVEMSGPTEEIHISCRELLRWINDTLHNLQKYEIKQNDPMTIESFLNKHHLLMEELGIRQAQLDHTVQQIGQLQHHGYEVTNELMQELQVLMDRWNLLSETLSFRTGTALHLLQLLTLPLEAKQQSFQESHQEHDHNMHSLPFNIPVPPQPTKTEDQLNTTDRLENLTADLLDNLETVTTNIQNYCACVLEVPCLFEWSKF